VAGTVSRGSVVVYMIAEGRLIGLTTTVKCLRQ
jgi:hypothetical protein